MDYLGCQTASLLLTIKLAALSVVVFLVLGIGLGYALSRPGFPLRRSLDMFLTLLLVFPPIATGFFLLLLLGRNGPVGGMLYRELGIDIVFSFNGLLVAAFVAGLPLVVKPIQSAIESSAKELVEASATLGKGWFETLLRVVIPGVRHSILAGLTLGVGRTFGEVGISLMLGGNIIGRTETLSLAIYNAVLDGNFACATKLSLLLAGFSILLFLMLRKLGRT